VIRSPLPCIRLLAFLCALSATVAYPHGGGIDSQGGHNNNSAGNYHFHQGSLSGKAFDSKSAATAALKGEVAPDPTCQVRVRHFPFRVYCSLQGREESSR
jgi:hypothetical protein